MSTLASDVLRWGFRRYVRRFVRKHFNAVRIAGLQELADLPPEPVVCFANHPGWWDPMTAVLMTDLLFPGRKFAAPMDAQALRSYPVLERLGFFPVQRESAGGVRDFLRTSRRLLANRQTILWLTPAGKFHDARQPAAFLSGLSRLADRRFTGTALPMAIEYTFWNERCPELLVRFGPRVDCRDVPDDPSARTAEFERALTASQAALAELAMARDPDGFVTVALGRGGIGGVYDVWRRVVARLQGRRFDRRHGGGEKRVAGMLHGDMA